jgi:hypothetical protein
VIREHTFNSAWWGAPVGIVSDPAFFALDPKEQRLQLDAYAWVEFVAPFDAVSPQTLTRLGFAQTDTQIGFKLDLRRLPPLPDFAALEVTSAAESPFVVEPGALSPFEHERFRVLPAITPAKLAERYTLWSNGLLARQPEWCLQLSGEGQVQGWFFSERDADGFHLTLAALHRAATVSGMLLYHKALSVYSGRGQHVGGARFSVTNTPVHNIYARLGARFLAPTGCWLWVRPDQENA